MRRTRGKCMAASRVSDPVILTSRDGQLRRAPGNERHAHAAVDPAHGRVTHQRVLERIAGIKALCRNDTTLRMPFDEVSATTVAWPFMDAG